MSAIGTNGDAMSLVERLEIEVKQARAKADTRQAELIETQNRTRWAWQAAAKERVGEHLLRTCELLGERIAYAVQDQNSKLIDDLSHILREVWEARWGMSMGTEHVAWEEPEPAEGEALQVVEVVHEAEGGEPCGG